MPRNDKDAKDDRVFRIRRRDALKGLATGTLAAGSVAPAAADAAAPAQATTIIRPPGDPDLRNPTVPWSRSLTADEVRTLGVLCDVILPADQRSPSATAVGVPAFIDEWVSAPYPAQQEDRAVVRGGLGWLNTESVKRFGKPFADLAAVEQHRICDDICHLPRARRQHRAGAIFFDRVRNLAMSGFYTTIEGMKDIGYVGNAPSATFDGPPAAVLARLKLGKSD